MTKFFTRGTHHESGFVGGPMTHPNKSKMALAAIFNFGKMSITLDWMKISCKKLYGKMHHGHAEMTT